MIDLKDIKNALGRIRPYVHKTPLIHSLSFSNLINAEVYLKTENLQKTGSFKVRGAFNKMMGVSGKRVIAASMGNHAQGVAFAAAALGKQARIVMPVTAPLVKQEATKGYGAEVLLFGENFQEALDLALSQKDHIFIHPFDDDEVIAGQGTAGLEILEDIGAVDAVLVPVGGGGLISGIAASVKAFSPKTEIIGVQTASAPSAYRSFLERHISGVTPSATLADGIAVNRIGEKTFGMIMRYVDDMILVSEDSIAMSILLFLERKKLVVEGAGAVPLAALIDNSGRFRGKRIVLLVSGGNIDFTLIDRIIHRGMVTSGRIGVFEVIVDDLPGRLHELTGIVAAHRGNILNVVHNRILPDLPLGKTAVIFTIETRGKGHLEEILLDLKKRGYEINEKKKD
ncbi:MAG: threonine ammonia-lyase [Nitrospirae bacterium]|nr:threonine ammonia-lyase [Nitrospirota bacterium]